MEMRNSGIFVTKTAAKRLQIYYTACSFIRWLWHNIILLKKEGSCYLKKNMQRKLLYCVNFIFGDPNRSHQQVAEAGCKLFLNMHEASQTTASLNLHRSVSHMRTELASLLPTEGAVMPHSYRVFHHLQLCQRKFLSFSIGNVSSNIV